MRLEFCLAQWVWLTITLKGLLLQRTTYIADTGHSKQHLIMGRP